jgi:uncharacterized protein YbjT (DUF2867 family)
VTQPVLVTGGTGTLGRRVVRRLKDAGCDVRVLARSSRPDETGIRHLTGDLSTGAGVGPAVDGVRAIVHCAGSSKGDDALTRNLVKAVTGEPHFVYISVVGADRIPVDSAVDRAMFGYFGSKRASEHVVTESGLPWTILRATQFYELVLTVARQLAKLPVVPLPSGSRFQPVETDEVAARLVELTLGEPAGLVPDLAGPRVYQTADLMRAYLRAAGRSRPILPVRLPGRAAAAVRAGATVAPEQAVGKRTWEEFLAAQNLGGH